MDWLLNAEEVADLLCLSKSKVYALFNDGNLSVVRLGRAIRVRRSVLEDFIQRSSNRAA